MDRIDHITGNDHGNGNQSAHNRDRQRHRPSINLLSISILTAGWALAMPGYAQSSVCTQGQTGFTSNCNAYFATQNYGITPWMGVGGTASGGLAWITGLTEADSLSLTPLNSFAQGANAIAIGDTTTSASGANSVAIGNGAQATANNSVALGQGSVANRANAVSVGAAGAERQIVNVAPGEVSATSTDAINGSQLNATNTQINNMSLGINQQVNRLENQIGRIEDRTYAGVAAAMAMATLPQAYLPGKSMVAIGGGTFNGEQGYAVGLSTISDNGRWVVKGAASGTSRSDYGASVGGGYQW
jgi:hypothetical protein